MKLQVQDILTLAAQGFTKEEIVKMSQMEEPPAKQEEPPAKQEEPPAKQEEPPAKQDQSLEGLASAVQALTEIVQKSALNNTNMPPQTNNVDDIMAQIIDPHRKEK